MLDPGEFAGRAKDLSEDRKLALYLVPHNMYKKFLIAQISDDNAPDKALVILLGTFYFRIL